MLLHTILVAFCLFSAFITLALGVYVFAKGPGSPIHRLFFFGMFTAMYWSFSEYLIWQSTSYEEFLFFLKTSSFWPLVVAFMLHFVLVSTGNRHLGGRWSKVVLALIYTPPICFALVEIATPLTFTVSALPGTGLVYLPVIGVAYMTEVAYMLVVTAMALFICIYSWRKAEEQTIRHQYLLISAGLAAALGFGSLSALILPLSGIYLPNIVFIGIVLFSIIIAYSIRNDELFTLNAGTAAPDIIRTLPDGLVLGDMDGTIVMVNARAAEIFGSREEELAGYNVGKFIGPEACGKIINAFKEKGIFSEIETILGEEKGKVLNMAGSIVREPGGAPAGFILILHDITKHKASEKALRLANEKITLMTRLTRHDVNNLLMALRGYLELMKNDMPGQDRELYLSRSIELSGKISRHIQFTREYQDVGIYDPGWQPLPSVCTKAIQDLDFQDIRINEQIGQIEIYADPLFHKVIYNVLENAVRHGSGLTTITISTHENGRKELIATIEDNGSGVPDEDKERIFNPGFGKNTGLGLALSKEILSITGIGIRETGVPGNGARFEMVVPDSCWRVIPSSS